MRLDHDFFCIPPSNNRKGIKSQETAQTKAKSEGQEEEEMELKNNGNEDEEIGVSYISPPSFVNSRSTYFMESMVNMPVKYS